MIDVESSSLPHDGEEDKKIKEYVTMKRVEAFILSEKTDSVLSTPGDLTGNILRI